MKRLEMTREQIVALHDKIYDRIDVDIDDYQHFEVEIECEGYVIMFYVTGHCDFNEVARFATRETPEERTIGLSASIDKVECYDEDDNIVEVDFGSDIINNYYLG